MMLADYLARRLLRSAFVVVGALGVVFLILRLAPGDPATLLLGHSASEEAVAALRDKLGLDSSIGIQFVRYLWLTAQGDLGESLTYQRPALLLVLAALGPTVLLSLAAFLTSAAVGVPLGILCAASRGSWVDRVVVSGVLLGQALPAFWIGMMLIYVFSVSLRWLPTSGSGTWMHVILPAITLAAFQLALLVRLVRSGMLDVLAADYVRTACAKGVSPSRVLLDHAFRNALLPVVTVLALQLGQLLAGTVVTEAVFAWPGMGSLAIRAILSRDYPLVQAVVVFSAFAIVCVNFIADAVSMLVDPRTRL